MKRKILVGLGNPEPKYEATYHNVGTLAVHAIAGAMFEADALHFEKHDDLFTYMISGNLIFVTLLTYMNESGIAVREALKKWDASPADLIVFQDESDLLLGTYKISKGQGAAGHRGIESIVNLIGSNDFTRVRIGIRDEKEVKRKKAGEFVLKTIKKKDMDRLAEVFKKISSELSL